MSEFLRFLIPQKPVVIISVQSCPRSPCVVTQRVLQAMSWCLLITPQNLFPTIPAIQDDGVSDQFQVGMYSFVEKYPSLGLPALRQPEAEMQRCPRPGATTSLVSLDVQAKDHLHITLLGVNSSRRNPVQRVLLQPTACYPTPPGLRRWRQQQTPGTRRRAWREGQASSAPA
jgi:hypothetical protein